MEVHVNVCICLFKGGGGGMGGGISLSVANWDFKKMLQMLLKTAISTLKK